MLEVIHRPKLGPHEPLSPSIEAYMSRFRWFDRTPCWLRLRHHFIGGAVRYSGTVSRRGFRLARLLDLRTKEKVRSRTLVTRPLAVKQRPPCAFGCRAGAVF